MNSTYLVYSIPFIAAAVLSAWALRPLFYSKSGSKNRAPSNSKFVRRRVIERFFEWRYKAESKKFEELISLLGNLASDRIQKYLDRDLGPWGSHEIFLMVHERISAFVSSKKGREALEYFVGPFGKSHLVAIEELWQPYLQRFHSGTLGESLLQDPLWAQIREHAHSVLSIIEYDFEKHEADYFSLIKSLRKSWQGRARI